MIGAQAGLRLKDTRSCQHRVVPGCVRAQGTGNEQNIFLVRHEMERGTTQMTQMRTIQVRPPWLKERRGTRSYQ